jgi:hypothetical protein
MISQSKPQAFRDELILIPEYSFFKVKAIPYFRLLNRTIIVQFQERDYQKLDDLGH